MFKRYGIAYLTVADAELDARERIRRLSAELESLGSGPNEVAEFTIRANTMRRNEYLSESNRIRGQMISAYADYAGLLEGTVRSLLQMQREMVEIMRLQAGDAPLRPR